MFVSGDGRTTPMMHYRGMISPIVVHVCDGPYIEIVTKKMGRYGCGLC